MFNSAVPFGPFSPFVVASQPLLLLRRLCHSDNSSDFAYCPSFYPETMKTPEDNEWTPNV